MGKLTITLEIIKERYRQDKKWGEQNHPCLDQVLLNREGGCTPQRMCAEYNIPTEAQAQQTCDINAKSGSLTWTDIALEEFCEVVGEFDPKKLRQEIIQLAAVCVAWVEKIDRDLKL